MAVGGMESSLAERAKGEPFHTVTPLLESWALSQVAGMPVFLKCENVQPTGSFKIRGIGHFCQEVRGAGKGGRGAGKRGRVRSRVWQGPEGRSGESWLYSGEVWERAVSR